MCNDCVVCCVVALLVLIGACYVCCCVLLLFVVDPTFDFAFHAFIVCLMMAVV